MYKQSINKSVIVLLIFAMITIVPTNSFASKPKSFNKYGVLRYQDVLPYIKNSRNSETVKIFDEYVTYYYNDDYTIVKDNQGYSKIDFKEDGIILVNNKEVESKIVEEKIDTNETALPFSISPTSTWVKYQTTYREYNVIDLAPSILGGIIGGAIGMKIGSIAGQVFSIVGGSIIGTIAGGRFPEYYISIKDVEYYQSPIVTSRPKIKTEGYVYHGPKYNRYQYYWFKL